MFCFQLGFQFGDALFQRRYGRFNFGGSVARRNVFRAVPIERKHVDEEESLDQAAGCRFGELGNQFWMLTGILHASVAEELQPFATRVVHEEESDAGIGGEVSSREHLAIAFVVSERELRSADDPEKPRRAATVLNVGPAILGDGRNVERVSRLDETALLIGERVLFGCGIHDRMASEVMILRREHRRREDGLQEAFSHGCRS